MARLPIRPQGGLPVNLRDGFLRLFSWVTRNLSFGSVYARLVLLLIFVLAPSLTFLVWTNSAYHAQVTNRARNDLVRQAHFVVTEETDVVENTRKLLSLLSPIVVERRGGFGEADRLFRQIVAKYSQYLNIGFATPDGNVAASALALSHPVNIADRDYFRRARQTRQLAIGIFQTGRITGLNSINLGYPVIDENNRVVGVLFAAIDLNWLNWSTSQIMPELPRGSSMMEIDSHGVVLVRWPEPGVFVGTSIASSALFRSMVAQHDGIVRSPGVDGREHLYAFTSIESTLFSGTIYIAVGTPMNGLTASAGAAVYSTVRNAALLILMAFVFFWAGAELLILRQIKVLLRISNQLRKGDFSARTHLPYRGEIGELARALDMTAEAIEDHVARQKRTEEQLRESERRYREFADFLPQVVFEIDLSGNITYVNRFASTMFGYVAEDLPDGRANVLAMLIPEERMRARANLEKVASGQAPASEEFTGLRRDGTTFPIVLYSSPVLKEGKAIGLRGLVIDLTDLKAAERELRESEQRLRQFQKIEAIGQLAGGVAHDFNNLLTAVQGYVQLARTEVAEGTTAASYLDRIRDIGKRGAQLTNQLLLFSRRAPMKFAPVNLNHTVQGVIRILDPLLGARFAIRENLDPSLNAVDADEGNLEQVLMNLILNARDVMPAGGSISISTRNIELDPANDQAPSQRGVAVTVPLETGRSGSFIAIAVRDSGAGMAQWVIDRLFEPFFTTKGRGEGSGLGLSVVYGIVKEHRGWIEVSTSPGEGSCFEVFLPAIVSRAVPDAENPRRQAAAFGHGERVLVVEDEADILYFLEAALSANGYLVTSAGNAERALELFGTGGGAFDMVLSDVALVAMDGVELVAELRRRRPDLPCVLTSGFLGDQSRLHPVEGGGFRFLQKPFSVEELLSAVAAAKREGRSPDARP